MTLTPIVDRQQLFQLRTDADLVIARRGVKDWAGELGLSMLDLTKVVTAASELARNAIVHGGGGVMCLQIVKQGERRGLRMTFKDEGPGIPDLELAMRDGYTTGSGLGLGLGGSKRLVDEFEIRSKLGEGTTVTVTKWR